jgi:hypothetical protein
MKKHRTLILRCGLAIVFGAVGSAAEPVVAVTCTATGPGVAACAAAGVVLHEVTKALNGQDAFGPNGEIRKALNIPIGNIRAASQESGEIAKVIRATTGISIMDIQKYGLLGGENSFFRKNLGLKW